MEARASRSPKPPYSKRTYDLVGNLLQLIEPNGNTHRFTYNGAGQVLTAEDSSRKVRFEYGGSGEQVAQASILKTNLRPCW